MNKNSHHNRHKIRFPWNIHLGTALIVPTFFSLSLSCTYTINQYSTSSNKQLTVSNLSHFRKILSHQLLLLFTASGWKIIKKFKKQISITKRIRKRKTTEITSDPRNSKDRKKERKKIKYNWHSTVLNVYDMPKLLLDHN